MVTRVLIVEDEPSLADAIKYGLEREGFTCTIAGDGSVALERFDQERPDLVILDLMLPGLPGVDVCRAVRRSGRTPIIVVSAKSAEVDKVVALEMGADDYVTKPFGMRELVARARSVLRRSGAESAPSLNGDRPTVLRSGPVELDVDRHECRVHGETVTLPPREFMLLEYLLRRTGRLCTRDALIADLWGNDYYGDTRTLDVHVRRLRNKIETDPKRPQHLQTVRGLGYKFEP
jgi:two-component system, OmpR family, response regulator RegX3